MNEKGRPEAALASQRQLNDARAKQAHYQATTHGTGSEAESISTLASIAPLNDPVPMSYRQKLVSFSLDSKPSAHPQVPQFQAHLGSFRFTRPLRRPWRTDPYPSR
jgi:hypothetical protein